MRLLIALILGLVSAAGFAQSIPPRAQLPVPDWLFPINPPPAANSPAPDSVKLLRIPNSGAAFTAADLVNLFFAPDWHPADHSPLPEVVARGRAPGVYACGFCHMPMGQGRPENAALAGLPTQYIIQQVADFKSGARSSALRDGYRPSDLMIKVAQNVDAADLTAAAQYFSAQRTTQRTHVIETDRVPRMHVVGWIFAADEGGATEPIGERLLEMTPDPELHEHRSDGLRYIAYAPPGSLARGRSIAHSLAHSSATACVACHGEGLRGVGLIPSLAGRSPSYILRQLLAFETGARAGAAGQPMKGVVSNLRLEDMIDVAAYAGSLQP